MKIRPKNIPMFQLGTTNGGISTVTVADPNSNWFTRVGDHGILEATYDNLRKLYDDWITSRNTASWIKYRKAVELLNKTQNQFKSYYTNYKNNGNKIFTGPGISEYLQHIDTNYKYINNTIGNKFNNYRITSKHPTTGDNPIKKWNYDGYWAAITNDRTPLGYINGINDMQRRNHWNQKFNEIGLSYDADGDVMYLNFLPSLINPNNPKKMEPSEQTKQPSIEKAKEIPISAPVEGPKNPINIDDLNSSKILESQFPVDGGKKYGYDWNKFKEGLLNLFNNPNLYGSLRLYGGLSSNEDVYGEYIKGVKPTLKQSYNTYRQVLGDEATKQGYYRRAIQGQTKAGRAITSDLDKLLAYLMENKRVGDELRAQGDLADNQRIRETSESSSQHLDANRQRATEVANANIASINDANSKIHTLLALKKAANWASIDNYIKSIETDKKLKKADIDSIQDLIFALDEQERLSNDDEFNQALTRWETWQNSHRNAITGLVDTSDKDYRNEKSLYDAALRNRTRKSLNRTRMYKLYGTNNFSGTQYAKEGTKITKKKKDDLLYKSTKDVVDHFRKMIALDRKLSPNKIEKLTPHPKGNTRKYLLGGTAPFYVWTPAVIGGETTTSTQTGTSSTRSGNTKSNSEFDLLKELFNNLKTEGLPSDTNVIYSSMMQLMLRKELFGNEISSDDLSTMYIQQMQRINTIKFNKALYDKVAEIVNNKNAGADFAIDLYGRVAVLNKTNGNIEYQYWDKIKENTKTYNPLTNGDLLTLRALFPTYAFDNTILQVAANATSMEEIAKFLKALLPAIESSESSIEGYTKKDTADIKSGIKTLLLDAPEGVYLYLVEDKTNQTLVRKALEYLYKILPNNMRTLLDIKSGGQSGLLIATMLGAKEFINTKISVDAAKGSGEDSIEKINSNPLMQLILGEGGVPRTWNLITKDSNVKMSVDGIEYSQLPRIKEDMSLDKMLSESGIAGILDSKQGVTFGDQNISPDLFKDIMYSNSGGMVVTLPCKIVNGHKEVNLGVKKTYEEAIQEVESKGISRNSKEYYKVLGEVLKQKGLNSLLDSNGYPDRNKFGQFLVVEAYTTDKIKNLDTSSQYIEKVKNPDALLEERMIKALSTDSKKSNYNLDIDYWLYGDDVYRGTLFIPLTNNLNAAINASGSLINVENARELENRFQNFNKASNMKSSNSDVL